MSGPLYRYAARLCRVVDGDTVWLDVDLGFRVTLRLDFRLLGIDAPELVGATRGAGLDAKAELERLLSLGPLHIESEKPGPTDKYGRWLARVFVTTPAGMLDVSEDLARRGFVRRYP